MKPLVISKANTVAQIFFAGFVMADLGMPFELGNERQILGVIVVLFTATSAVAYLVDWIGHMTKAE